MIRRPPRSTRTDTLFPYTTLFRSVEGVRAVDSVQQETVKSFQIPARVRVLSIVLPSAAPQIMAGGSEEHTSELQSLMRISYAVFCLKKKNKQHIRRYNHC